MNRRLLLWLGSLVVVVGIYAASYYAMLGPIEPPSNEVVQTTNVVNGIEYTITLGEFTPAPIYRFGGEFSERFFSPMHELDKHIRPHTWKASP